MIWVRVRHLMVLGCHVKDRLTELCKISACELPEHRVSQCKEHRGSQVEHGCLIKFPILKTSGDPRIFEVLPV